MSFVRCRWPHRSKGLILLQLDHITIAADSLRAGVAYAEAALGVSIPFGGVHPLMGTHNHLLRLGEALFLEIIAPDPAAGPLRRRRWFSLDDPKLRAELAMSPRLLTWVVATDSIETALRQVPRAAGPAITVTRGELTWLISVPPDGAMPFDGAFPTLIEWPRGPHPASRMPDLGCSLVALEVAHPEAETIGQSLRPFFGDVRVRFSPAEKPQLRATIRTPSGERELR
jgi:Glyoxalase-like domain